jgi:hypothetical protein
MPPSDHSGEKREFFGVTDLCAGWQNKVAANIANYSS